VVSLIQTDIPAPFAGIFLNTPGFLQEKRKPPGFNWMGYIIWFENFQEKIYICSQIVLKR